MSEAPIRTGLPHVAASGVAVNAYSNHLNESHGTPRDALLDERYMKAL